MNNKNIPATWEAAIVQAETQFTEIALAEGNLLNYKKEALFAMQLLSKNAYSLEAAKADPQAVLNAVINVASIGLSLNPAEKLAYLVPRDKKICLDVSYLGLIKLATDTGNIIWAKAELVYEKDVFKMTGINSLPLHEYNPFSLDRGKIIGGYSAAKLAGGDHIVDAQAESYFMRCKAVSPTKTKPIWEAWGESMRLKTLIKVGSKFWPKSKKLDAAIHYLNENEGIDLENEAPERPPVTMPKAKEEAALISEPMEQPPSEDAPKVVQGEVVAQTDSKPIGDNMLRVLKMQITGGKKSEAEVLVKFGVERLEQIQAAKINDVLKFVRG